MSVSSILPVESPELFSWLTYKEKLSDRLLQVSGEAELEVLNHGWTRPNWWDKHVLGINESIISREILMHSQQQPCWYARTIISETCFKADPAFFSRLEKESLGNLIFDNPLVERGYLNFYPVSSPLIEFHWLQPTWCSNQPLLWLRKSCFIFRGNYRFYLLEILLPGLLRFL